MESRVVDHCAWWGPTGLEAVAVTTPTHSEARPVTASSTRVRVTLRKRTVRAVHHREQAARLRRSSTRSGPIGPGAVGRSRTARPSVSRPSATTQT